LDVRRCSTLGIYLGEADDSLRRAHGIKLSWKTRRCVPCLCRTVKVIFMIPLNILRGDIDRFLLVCALIGIHRAFVLSEQAPLIAKILVDGQQLAVSKWLIDHGVGCISFLV
jgi:hypothetical protein